MGIYFVLDTNILVSAGIRPGGPPDQIVQAVARPCCASRVSICNTGISRCGYATSIALGFSAALSGLIDCAHRLARDPLPWPMIGPDPDDLKFLALAYFDCGLVSGNLGDFPAEIRRGVRVVSAAAYVSDLRNMGHDL